MKKLDLMQYFFTPKSIAVIGASQDKGSVGFVVLENFAKGKYKGKLYAVNPKHKKVQGIQSYASILDVQEEVEHAIITVPAKIVPLVLEQCGKKKVKAVTIVSAGFAEIGDHVLTEKLQAVMNTYKNMKVIGPNCLGQMYIKEHVDALFLPPYRLKRPKNGTVSFISQSGALGSAILDWAGARDYGINKFISYGNAMDIDEADLLEYLGEDKETKVIAMYIEGVRNGRKFFKIAKKVAKRKPVILIKGGMSEEGNKATLSHTGSLAGSAQVYKAVFKQTGIIHAKTMKQVFDFAKLFSNEPLMKGNRIQTITNGGGYGVLATDGIIQSGLQLAQPSSATKKAIRKVVPSYAIIENPIDLTGDADDKRYEVAVKACLADKNIDAIILILLFQVPTLSKNIDKVMEKILKTRKKPVIVMSAGGHYAAQHKKHLERHNIATFSSPFPAAHALKAMYEYGKKH
jgi:acetate---CoA ligase (ADP-forming)